MGWLPCFGKSAKTRDGEMDDAHAAADGDRPSATGKGTVVPIDTVKSAKDAGVPEERTSPNPAMAGSPRPVAFGVSPSMPRASPGRFPTLPTVPDKGEDEEDEDRADCESISSREEEELEIMAKLGTPLPPLAGALYIAPSKTRASWNVEEALRQIPAPPPPPEDPPGMVPESSDGVPSGPRLLQKNASRLVLLPSPGTVVSHPLTVSRIGMLPAPDLATATNGRPSSASANKMVPKSALDLLMSSDYPRRGGAAMPFDDGDRDRDMMHKGETLETLQSVRSLGPEPSLR